MLRQPLSDRAKTAIIRRWAIDTAWVAFLIAISTTLYKFDPIGVERLSWLAGDAAVAVLFWPARRQLVPLMRQNRLFLSWPLLACLSALWSLD
ncbi:MAG: hypothetical protein ACREMY_25850, partial [bacterium]